MILIVEDDKDILSSLSAILELEGYAVETAETAQQALKKCGSRFYNLALVNLGLQDMNGADLIALMDESTPDTVKIILTGFSKERALEATKRGADGYLTKPADPEDLLRMIKDKLKKKGAQP